MVVAGLLPLLNSSDIKFGDPVGIAVGSSNTTLVGVSVGSLGDSVGTGVGGDTTGCKVEGVCVVGCKVRVVGVCVG